MSSRIEWLPSDFYQAKYNFKNLNKKKKSPSVVSE